MSVRNVVLMLLVLVCCSRVLWVLLVSIVLFCISMSRSYWVVLFIMWFEMNNVVFVVVMCVKRFYRFCCSIGLRFIVGLLSMSRCGCFSSVVVSEIWECCLFDRCDIMMLLWEFRLVLLMICWMLEVGVVSMW